MTEGEDHINPTRTSWGLTKREYFAAKALATVRATHTPEQTAAVAVRLADALIEELNRHD